jgi:hypothetical protein
MNAFSFLVVCVAVSAVCAAIAVCDSVCDLAPSCDASASETLGAADLRRRCNTNFISSSEPCHPGMIGDDLPIFCVGAFDMGADAPLSNLLFMLDPSPSWLWVAVKYVSPDTASTAPEVSSGHSASFCYHVDQHVLQRLAAPAADIFMREDESLVAAVMGSAEAFQAVRRNILAGEPWFKDTHTDHGLLGEWMRPLHANAQVPDALAVAFSDGCSYSICPSTPEWQQFPCDLWTRLFMSCYNGSASHADLRANWRLRGDSFFTTASAHSIWFKLPAALLTRPVWPEIRAASRQGFADGMLGARTMRIMALERNDVLRLLRGKRVLMVGDSNMRYQYLDLAYFLCFGVWPSLSGDKERMQWLWRVSYLWDHDHSYSQTWHEMFLSSTALFRGLQQCDCFRPSNKNPNWKRMSFESRITHCNGVTLEYHQYFGPSSSLSGRLPLHAASFAGGIGSRFKMEAVCNGSGSIIDQCLGDGRFLWGGDIMDCAPPGVTLFDLLPPCDAPWQMDLPRFLEDVGSSGGGVDVLLLNYGVQPFYTYL